MMNISLVHPSLSEYDETGIDVVEAINFGNDSGNNIEIYQFDLISVNAAKENEVDGSKDFNEKEISISSLQSKQIFGHDEMPCTKIPEFKQIKQASSRHLLKASRTTPTNPSRPSLGYIGTIKEEKIKKSKIKARRKINENQVFYSLSLKNVNAIIKYPTFDQELLNEFKINHKNVNESFGKFSLTDHGGPSKTKVSLDAKYYSNQNQWVDCKVVIFQNEGRITISNNADDRVTLGVADIECVKVEDNKRVIWIKVTKGTINQLGILLENVPDAEFLMMALDFLWKKSCSKTNIFMNCDKYLQCSESPLLHKENVQWRRASNQVMEYLGQYCYHLKTAQKEIKSLQAVNIYLK